MAMAQPSASAIPTRILRVGRRLMAVIFVGHRRHVRATNAPQAATVVSALLAPSWRLSDMRPP